MPRTALLLLLLTPTLAGAQPRILQPGAFHGDEVTTPTGEEWFALYPGSHASMVRRERVTIAPVFDPVIDADGEATGREVAVASGGAPLLLVSGLRLEEGAVESARVEPQARLAGAAVSLELDGRKLTLYACATVEFSPHGEPLSSNYELVLSDGETEQVLLELPTLDDAVPALLWAGDLDRDGRLDLVIDTTYHYNLSSPTLFLSRPADRDAHVKEVATFSSVGC